MSSTRRRLLIKNFPTLIAFEETFPFLNQGSLTDSQESRLSWTAPLEGLAPTTFEHTPPAVPKLPCTQLGFQELPCSGVLSLVSSILHAFPMALDH